MTKTKILVLIILFPFALFCFVLGSALFIYYRAPIDKLKNQIHYSPINSKKTRVAGLKSPTTVPLSQIPKIVRDVILICEDANFFSHSGFDFGEIEKAIRDYQEEGRRLRGASTISQQLVKNIFLNNDRTLIRKLKEAIYTVKLERTLSKQEILTLYLSNIEWGKGVYGIQEASWHYFKKPPSDLNLIDSIFLAVIIPNPVKYSRSFHQGKFSRFIESRIKQVLSILNFQGKIDMSAELVRLERYFMSEQENALFDEIKEPEPLGQDVEATFFEALDSTENTPAKLDPNVFPQSSPQIEATTEKHLAPSISSDDDKVKIQKSDF